MMVVDYTILYNKAWVITTELSKALFLLSGILYKTTDHRSGMLLLEWKVLVYEYQYGKLILIWASRRQVSFSVEGLYCKGIYCTS